MLVAVASTDSVGLVDLDKDKGYIYIYSISLHTDFLVIGYSRRSFPQKPSPQSHLYPSVSDTFVILIEAYQNIVLHSDEARRQYVFSLEMKAKRQDKEGSLLGMSALDIALPPAQTKLPQHLFPPFLHLPFAHCSLNSLNVFSHPNFQ
jgi:hypothetical protein